MPGYDHKFDVFDAAVGYRIRKVEKVENGPGCWDSSRLEIYHDTAPETVIYSYVRNYGSYGTTAFYPFKYKDRWYAFISKTYTSTQIIDLETQEIMAEGKAMNWCPTNFYVPARYCNPDEEPFHTDNNGKKCWLVKNDWEFEPDPEDDSCDVKQFDQKYLHYLNLCFVAGVYWAADAEWLVYCFDIDKCFETGKIPIPEMDKLLADQPIRSVCEFDYGISPNIRLFVKMQDGWNYREGEDMNYPFFTYRRFTVYSQVFTDDAFADAAITAKE